MRPSSASFNAWLAAGVFIVVLLDCIWWSAGVPFDGAPDEKDHYEMQEFVARNGRLPRYGEKHFRTHLREKRSGQRLYADSSGRIPAGVDPQGWYEVRSTYLFSPQMPYWVGGWFLRALGTPTPRKARFFSGLCIALASSATCWMALTLWPGAAWAGPVAGLATGLWPQMTFVGSYVNDDAFSILAASLLLLAVARIEVAGLDRRRALGLGVALGLVGASKYYCLALLPPFFVWAAIRGLQGGRRFRGLLVWSGVLALFIAGIWLVRNAILYGGDALGRRTLSRYVGEFVAGLPAEVAARTPRQQISGSLRARGEPIWQLFELGWVRHTFESFWARFGWMRVRVHPLLYGTALVAGILSLVAAAWSGRRAISEWRKGIPLRLVPLLFAVPTLAILVALSLWNSYNTEFQPQGRYLLVGVPALVLQGIEPLTGWGHRRRRIGAALFASFFLLQNLLARLVYLR